MSTVGCKLIQVPFSIPLAKKEIELFQKIGVLQQYQIKGQEYKGKQALFGIGSTIFDEKGEWIAQCDSVDAFLAKHSAKTPKSVPPFANALAWEFKIGGHIFRTSSPQLDEVLNQLSLVVTRRQITDGQQVPEMADTWKEMIVNFCKWFSGYAIPVNTLRQLDEKLLGIVPATTTTTTTPSIGTTKPTTTKTVTINTNSPLKSSLGLALKRAYLALKIGTNAVRTGITAHLAAAPLLTVCEKCITSQSANNSNNQAGINVTSGILPSLTPLPIRGKCDFAQAQYNLDLYVRKQQDTLRHWLTSPVDTEKRDEWNALRRPMLKSVKKCLFELFHGALVMALHGFLPVGITSNLLDVGSYFSCMNQTGYYQYTFQRPPGTPKGDGRSVEGKDLIFRFQNDGNLFTIHKVAELFKAGSITRKQTESVTSVVAFLMAVMTEMKEVVDAWDDSTGTGKVDSKESVLTQVLPLDRVSRKKEFDNILKGKSLLSGSVEAPNEKNRIYSWLDGAIAYCLRVLTDPNYTKIDQYIDFDIALAYFLEQSHIWDEFLKGYKDVEDKVFKGRAPENRILLYNYHFAKTAPIYLDSVTYAALGLSKQVEIFKQQSRTRKSRPSSGATTGTGTATATATRLPYLARITRLRPIGKQDHSDAELYANRFAPEIGSQYMFWKKYHQTTEMKMAELVKQIDEQADPLTLEYTISAQQLIRRKRFQQLLLAYEDALKNYEMEWQAKEFIAGILQAETFSEEIEKINRLRVLREQIIQLLDDVVNNKIQDKALVALLEEFMKQKSFTSTSSDPSLVKGFSAFLLGLSLGYLMRRLENMQKQQQQQQQQPTTAPTSITTTTTQGQAIIPEFVFPLIRNYLRTNGMNDDLIETLRVLFESERYTDYFQPSDELRALVLQYLKYVKRYERKSKNLKGKTTGPKAKYPVPKGKIPLSRDSELTQTKTEQQKAKQAAAKVAKASSSQKGRQARTKKKEEETEETEEQRERETEEEEEEEEESENESDQSDVMGEEEEEEGGDV